MGAAALLASPAILEAQDSSATAFPTAIGDSARDLVFTPVPRCRVIDTRLEGGRLTAGVPRNVDVAGTLVGQGGASDCLVPYGSATVIVLNLVAVQPLGAGTLTAWPFGGAMPTANVISYNGRRALAGANAANEVTLAICDPALSSCTYDLTLQANGGDTHLVADVAGYYAPVTGLTVPWSAVTGKPASFEDGMDDDTLYSAGAGLSQSGTVFSVDTSAIQSRVIHTCPLGAAIRAIQPNGQVLCETDDDTTTTYTAGNGLLLSGTTFLVNPSIVQSRVTQTCPAGSSIRAIDVAGVVTCESDTNTTYTAGAGINLSGSTISVPNLGIASSMLAAGAVTAGKIASNAVKSAEIADRNIVTADIAEGAITNAELAPFAVGPGKISSGVVGQAEIAADGVSAIEIAPGAVGASEIAAGAVGRSEIDGTEVKIYRGLSACGSSDVITLNPTCTTNFCAPSPIGPLFWDCTHTCDSLVPLTCDNTLLGYLLSPNIE
jgi:hypothetical protein